MLLTRSILIGIFFLLFSTLQPSFADPPLPTPVGRVVWVKGTFTATMANNEKRILQKTSVIYLHDTLTTDNTSEAQIVFTDNTLMAFRSATTFNIDDYHSNLRKKTNPLGAMS